ncbi:hypothetical protein RHGRI_036996 [Rhododendron griersonianum]|uniref:Uncharacterized protein n=1 Tax=Rhododendron griersonianum TaxID=479676 RepID=A0AAV6HR73_9ERIC|nr:hypothetical protein RHGRI_036996 [Rhododendron griersonianum]
MLTTLRTRDYTLFANAIFATNLFPDVLAVTSFTFFAPTDSSLHALDMAATAEDYVVETRNFKKIYIYLRIYMILEIEENMIFVKFI